MPNGHWFVIGPYQLSLWSEIDLAFPGQSLTSLGRCCLNCPAAQEGTPNSAE